MAWQAHFCTKHAGLHVGVVLDYLQDRIAEPCGRTVPEAVLEALVFMEKKGGYDAGKRLADLPILKNCVNQATRDLRGRRPPTKKAPLLPLMLVGALEQARVTPPYYVSKSAVFMAPAWLVGGGAAFVGKPKDVL